MNNSEKKISDFYDSFAAQQAATGINERIFYLFEKMKQLGLTNNSNVLELGCGIGALTFLLSKKIKNGIIESVDISPNSVRFAREKIKSKNISFHAADVVSYKPVSNCTFDFITLFDVIEHIPIEHHNALFANVSLSMHEKTMLLINIPNPLFIEYDKKYQPDVLQVIDQPVYLNILSENLFRNNLIIELFNTHSIWFENDYQFLVVRKKSEFKNIKLSAHRNILQKIFHRLIYGLRKLANRYP